MSIKFKYPLLSNTPNKQDNKVALDVFKPKFMLKI